VIDEFQLFLTPDIPEMLDQAAKYGLHLLLFHQHLSQLKAVDLNAYGAMSNARIKLVFGGLSREDARFMAEEIYPGQVDLKRVKFLIEQTKFWPVYARDSVYMSGSGRGSASVASSGQTWNPSLEEWVPSTVESGIDSSTEHEGQADIPIFMPVPFKELSSITPYSLEETLWEMSDRLMEQYQRHFMIRVPGQPTRAAVTPFVKNWFVKPATLAAYKDRISDAFLRAVEVDAALLQIHNELSIAATGRPLLTGDTEMLEFSDAPPIEFLEKKKR
jgi:hypothetical protein